MKILGFQSGHDVSYCVLKDGVPIIHEELERFTREKEPLGDGLDMAFQRIPDDELKDISHICYGNPGGRIGRYKEKCGLEDADKKLKSLDVEYSIVGHHQSHAANAFFSSNFDEALIITIDGSGTDKEDWEDVKSEEGETRTFSTAFTFWEGKGTKIKPIKRIDMFECTLGSPYKIFTRDIFGLSAGYPYGNQCGTVMAMACMGDSEKYWKTFYDSIKRGGGGPSPYNQELCVKFKQMIDDETDEKKKETLKFDISAGIQKAVEVIAREYMTPMIEAFKPKHICMSGGVVLNSVMVGKMYDWFPMVEKIYVCPVPYDGGLSIGAAQYIYHQVLDYPRVKWGDNSPTYLGCSYGLEDIQTALDEVNDKIITEETDDDSVAMLLATDDNVISVFGGGSESGRRALGNRSILADPRSPNMKDIINEKVKHRQWFRPFAPSIIAESVKDWFERDVESPYMTTVIKFKEEVRDKVPAVVHFDGSARLQTVTEKDNTWYYNFIKKFETISDVPILLNTSFNDREPIVETPAHAIDCFLRTNIDYLYFREFGILVSKNTIENKLSESVVIKTEQKPNNVYQVDDICKSSVKGKIPYTSELYDFDIMKKGVLQHIDRDYEYDVVPPEIEGGYLYQPVHRTPPNTKISFEVKKPTDIYVAFHKLCDGGWTEKFKKLDNWKLCDEAPVYDTYGKNEHGFDMIMYKLEAKPGTYELPITKVRTLTEKEQLSSSYGTDGQKYWRYGKDKVVLCYSVIFKPHSELKDEK